MRKLKFNHLESKAHKTVDESNKGRYFTFSYLLTLFFDQNDEIMKRCFNIYNKKYEKNLDSCVLNLITITNRVRIIKNNTKLKLEYLFLFSRKSNFDIVQD